MSDNLFERLTDLSIGTGSQTPMAAIDRIEKLEDSVANMAGLWAKSDSEKQLLLGRIEKLEATLTDIISEYDEPDNGRSLRWAIDAGRELLKGQNDE